jgi:hypothetical protein
LSAADLAKLVDAAIDARVQEEQAREAPQADDAEFLRRVYLDLTGHVPPTDKALAFLDSRDPAKRARLIDELLASPAYGKHLADLWDGLLVPHTSDNRRVRGEPLVKWLEESFNTNKPWDAMVRELITASGKQDENGAITFFLANPTADKATDATSRLFLGVQLQCAQCHDHPFTAWKQTEYWGMAAFFLKVQPDMGKPKNIKDGVIPSVSEGANVRRQGLPDSAKMVPAKFLGGATASLNKSEPYRPVLADWLTSPKNPYFSKAMVNRTWAQLFGRGIVNPVDDMHEGNAPSHPQLLADLADQFAANEFDLKNLTRALCLTRAYQRTSKPTSGSGEAAPELFARMAVKVLTPEQLFDSLSMVVRQPGMSGPTQPVVQQQTPARPAFQFGKNGPGKALAQAKAQRAQAQAKLDADSKSPANTQPKPMPLPPGMRANFVTFFRPDDGADPTEYQAGIPQALRLMNSPQINGAIAGSPVTRPGRNAPETIEHIYVAALARRPNQRELERAGAYVRKQTGDPHQAYTDLLWALLNSSEFTLNR